MVQIRRICVGFLFLLLAACAMQPGSYSKSVMNGTERMYRYDEGGKKVLVYEVDPAGKMAVLDPNDKQVKQRLAQQRLGEQVQQANVDRLEKIKQAPKRRANDPIYVNFRPMELDAKLSQMEKPKGAFFEQIKKEFANDPVIKLVGKDKVRLGELGAALGTLRGQSSQRATAADVEVAFKGYMKEVYGFAAKGKPGSMMALVLEASITGNYLPATEKVEETGNIFQNVELTKRLAEKVKKAIKEQLGPTIPADRSI